MHMFLVLPSGAPPVSRRKSQGHSYHARFDYVLIQSNRPEGAPLISQTRNNAYWLERHMADSRTRLGPQGNIISAAQHVYVFHRFTPYT